MAEELGPRSRSREILGMMDEMGGNDGQDERVPRGRMVSVEKIKVMMDDYDDHTVGWGGGNDGNMMQLTQVFFVHEWSVTSHRKMGLVF